jgi:riboflavin synthase
VFTGLVEIAAAVVQLVPEPPGCRLVLRAPEFVREARLGDSIAINGCCLTVVEIEAENLHFQAGPETLAKTNLGGLQPGTWVNLERALRVGDRLGGHYVTGHVDAVGSLLERFDDRDWSTLWFSAPAKLLKQMASKGSIAIDGVSLTLVEVAADRFSVALIPHTLALTTLGSLEVGGRVNLETDLLAKYVEQQLRPS